MTLALVTVTALVVFAQFASQPISPPNTPYPPGPPLMQYPLGPPPPPELDERVEYASIKGFALTKMETQGELSAVLVLPQGEAGSIPVTLISTGDENYTISLGLDLLAGGQLKGVKYTFLPSTFSLKAGSQISSILSVQADSDAPTAFYNPIVDIYVKEYESNIGKAFFELLVYPHTPSYIFTIFGPSQPEQPTSANPPRHPETPPKIVIPNVKAKLGEPVYVMFDIESGMAQVKVDLTYGSGAPPLDVATEAETFYLSPYGTYEMLRLTPAAGAPEGTYRMVAKISVKAYGGGVFAAERILDLTVTKT
jgi:hypothetical protein